jgi:hypothetical protein
MDGRFVIFAIREDRTSVRSAAWMARFLTFAIRTIA